MPLTIVDNPHVLLTHPVDEVITGSGVDNDVPLEFTTTHHNICLLYTSDAADDLCV